MSIADKLQELIDSKADMKSAIAEKGVEVEGGLTSYASAIRKIQQGSGEGSDIDWNGVRFGGSSRIPLQPSEMYKCGNMDYMFSNCKLGEDGISGDSLEIDTSFATSLRGCFKDAWSYTLSIRRILNWNVSNVTDLSYCFENSTNLLATKFNEGELDVWDTSNVKRFDYCFAEIVGGFYELETIPHWDFSSAESVAGMLSGQPGLKKIPRINLKSLNSWRWMLESTITDQNGDDTGSTGTRPMIYYELTDIGGFVDLKAMQDHYFIQHCPNLTVESLNNIIRDLYDWETNPESLNVRDYNQYNYDLYNALILNFGEVNLNKLTDDQIAIAIAKGWTLI